METEQHRCCTCGQEIKYFMPARVSLRNNTFAYGARTVRLTPSQAVLVHQLLEAKGAIVSTDGLCEALYGQGVWPDDPRRTVWVQMYWLRQKLKVLGVHIESKVRTGYWMFSSVESRALGSTNAD